MFLELVLLNQRLQCGPERSVADEHELSMLMSDRIKLTQFVERFNYIQWRFLGAQSTNAQNDLIIIVASKFRTRRSDSRIDSVHVYTVVDRCDSSRGNSAEILMNSGN